ncbi:MAG: N-acetylmuramoyl-L-alanine amidase [Micrococcales bacterium]|nr:N-acetylmuramoyl-L-alanine amidase [Micrococcales bacterium]
MSRGSLGDGVRRAITATGLATVLVAAAACGTATGPDQSASTSAGPRPTSSPTSSGAATSATSAPDATSLAPGAQALTTVTVSPDWIPYSDTRKAQMAAYAQRRYGTYTWRLSPKTIVLHFTENDSWSSVRGYFAQNIPNGGEYPNVCSHYIIDKAGVVHGIVPTSTMCRHTIGLNHVAIAIEFVQSSYGNGSHWADQQILARTAQVEAGRALVRQLMAQYAIPDTRVIGHASANSSPYFKDLTGARNDHTDWLAEDVARFRVGLVTLDYAKGPVSPQGRRS